MEVRASCTLLSSPQPRMPSLPLPLPYAIKLTTEPSLPTRLPATPHHPPISPPHLLYSSPHLPPPSLSLLSLSPRHPLATTLSLSTTTITTTTTTTLPLSLPLSPSPPPSTPPSPPSPLPLSLSSPLLGATSDTQKVDSGTATATASQAPPQNQQRCHAPAVFYAPVDPPRFPTLLDIGR